MGGKSCRYFHLTTDEFGEGKGTFTREKITWEPHSRTASTVVRDTGEDWERQTTFCRSPDMRHEAQRYRETRTHGYDGVFRKEWDRLRVKTAIQTRHAQGKGT